jgi:hypothetical protein
VCQKPVKPGELGLRDYRWLSDALPGRNGAGDIDGLITQNKTGRALMLEFKPGGAALPLGQRLALQLMVRKDIDVWVAWDEDLSNIEVRKLDRDGQLSGPRYVDQAGFAGMLRAWWDKGLA